MQRHCALHGVEPKRLTSTVSVEPQRGHSTTSVPRNEGDGAPRGGGAMPYALSCSRPRSLIQSVVQAGESCVSIATSANPPASYAARTIISIATVAGQPV